MIGFVSALAGLATVGGVIGNMAISPLYTKLEEQRQEILILGERFYLHSDGHPSTVTERIDGLRRQVNQNKTEVTGLSDRFYLHADGHPDINRMVQLENKINELSKDVFSKTDANRELELIRRELTELRNERSRP